MIITDMNRRERERFVKAASELATAASELSDALRTGDDAEALMRAALTGLAGQFMRELTQVFTDAVTVTIPDSPSAATPPAPPSVTEGTQP